jgi:hypothetical protein
MFSYKYIFDKQKGYFAQVNSTIYVTWNLFPALAFLKTKKRGRLKCS